MKLKKFEEYDFSTNTKKDFNKIVPKKTNEAAFVVDDNYKVKLTFDVPKTLVDEYIAKVKEETGKTPLDFFNKNEIAEEIIQYIVKSNLVIDNLASSFTVGTENTVNDEEIESDLEDVEFDFEIPEDNENDEIEFDLDESDSDIGDIEIDNDVEEDDSEDGFETIEFDDEPETSKGTVADYKKKANMMVSEEEEEEIVKSDTEYDIDDLYRKIGIKTNYYESIDFSCLKK